MSVNSIRRKTALLLKALLTGANTVPELAQKAGMDYETVRPFVKELHDAGVVYIVAYRRQSKRGSPAAVYALGDHEDAKRPAPKSSLQRQREYMHRKTDKPLRAAPKEVKAPSSVFDLGRHLGVTP